jgi:FAD/FMN-containing dehydrogenase
MPSPPRWSRRALLARAALGLGALARPARRGSAPGLPWAALRARLAGTLVLPTDPGYAEARELFNPTFDAVRPAAVAYCARTADVQACIAFARQHGLPLAVRAGGHSYAGYSTGPGLVVDVSRMAGVGEPAADGTVRVGAGIRQVDLYAGLARWGRTVPGASCATVGLAGLAQGGGIGVLDRLLGLTLDNVVGLEVVTADAVVRRVDAATEPDLFWACRGGGGGNFGVVTAFRLQTHVVGELTVFATTWDWDGAAQLVPAWLEWAPTAPDALWANLTLGGVGPGGRPSLRVAGVFAGPPSGLAPLLAGLTRRAGARPATATSAQLSLLDAMLAEAGCEDLGLAACHLASPGGPGRLHRQAFAAKSDFVDRPLGDRGVDALLRAVEAAPAGTAVLCDPWGGAIGRVAPDATAFVHRRDLCSVQYYAAWSAARPGAEQAARAWLASVWSAMRPFVSGYAYQNYIDPELPDWLHAYYGQNLPRLVAVKARYDPDDVFRFAQSIPVRL